MDLRELAGRVELQRQIALLACKGERLFVAVAGSGEVSSVEEHLAEEKQGLHTVPAARRREGDGALEQLGCTARVSDRPRVFPCAHQFPRRALRELLLPAAGCSELLV